MRKKYFKILIPAGEEKEADNNCENTCLVRTVNVSDRDKISLDDIIDCEKSSTCSVHNGVRYKPNVMLMRLEPAS